MNKLYRVPEVAELLAVHANTVKLLIQRGELGSVKVGRARRITQQDVDDYIQRLRETACLT